MSLLNTLTFLRESNAIESEYSEIALRDAEIAFAYLMKQMILTKDVVLEVHRLLTVNSKLAPPLQGHFRTTRVWINTWTGLQEQMKPQYIEDAIAEWLPAMNTSDPNFNDWKVLHIIFERIHPFIDFNGRVGRMFMNWHRLMSGMPLMTIYEKDRNKYYEWFKE